MTGNYDLSGTGSHLPEPDEADLKRAEQGHREWVMWKGRPPEALPQLPSSVAATVEAERLKHEADLIDELMAYWRAQDEAEVREYTKAWMRFLVRRETDRPVGTATEQAEIIGPTRESPPVNAFLESWRTFARKVFSSVVSALADGAKPLTGALDAGAAYVANAIFGEHGAFDRLLKQTLFASFEAEAASAQCHGYRLYLPALAHTIDQAIELERARWRGRRASQTPNLRATRARRTRTPDPEALERLQKSQAVSLRTIADATGKTVDAVRKKLKREGVTGHGAGQSKRFPSKRVREIFNL